MQPAKYIHSPRVHNLNAPAKVVPLVMELFHPRSVLDVGCGIGTWLNKFKEAGVNEVVGLDGDYVDREVLKQYINMDEFRVAELANPFDLGRKFDLVLSLEVAEHLPESVAATFVDSLIRHGDTILFSAAIPNQGGQNHLNEQWKSYWISLFANHGYKAYDLIRPSIWEMPEVEYWYKQNMLVFSKPDLSHLKPDNNRILEAVHPEMFAAKMEWLANYINGLHEQIAELENKSLNKM